MKTRRIKQHLNQKVCKNYHMIQQFNEYMYVYIHSSMSRNNWKIETAMCPSMNG